MFERDIVKTLRDRLIEARRFIQIVIGPRQTGKSTAVAQALSTIDAPVLNFTFDRSKDQNLQTLEEVWLNARQLLKKNEYAILSLDEIQKVRDWSSTVKYLWDQDSLDGRNLKVVLTGSSALNLRSGMSESLKGRFEEIHSTQWTLSECTQAFGFDLQTFLYYGGYPGSAPLINYIDRWFAYLNDSIIDPTITQDVLEMESIRKPALMRALFEIGAVYSAQEISYRKLLGQLDDKGNTETVSHYLSLLSYAGLLSGLSKYDPKILKSKTSSPRLMVHDSSLMTAALEIDPKELESEPSLRGHLVESAVGAYLINRAKKDRFRIHWWRDRGYEVDFIIVKGRKRTAIEVKSGNIGPLKGTKGLGEFVRRYPGTYTLIIGSDETPLEEFLLGNVPLFQ